MTRKRYVQDKKTLKLVPYEEYYGLQEPAGPMIMPDIKPYQSMATGEMIGGRRQHREHLRQHGLIEIGNEPIRPPERRPDPTIRRDVIEAVKRHWR